MGIFLDQPKGPAAGILPLETRRQIRKNLVTGAIAFIVLMFVTLLMIFTPVFDGHVGGIGVGYIVGFADFLIVLVLAGLHCVRSNRLDDASQGLL